MLSRAAEIAFMVGLTVLSCLSCEAQTAAGVSSLVPLLKVLQKAKVSGSLELPICTRGVPESPKLREAAGTATSVLQTVREMYADHPDIEITQGADGIVRIVQRETPSDLLRVRISEIQFSGTSAVYGPNAAVPRIFAAPEVQRFMKDHDMQTLGGVLGGALATPPVNSESQLQPLTGSLYNVTFSQALDYLLGRFPGIWVYRDCPATKKTSRTVEVWFFHLMVFEGEWEVVE